jgi:hypothetical protein
MVKLTIIKKDKRICAVQFLSIKIEIGTYFTQQYFRIIQNLTLALNFFLAFYDVNRSKKCLQKVEDFLAFNQGPSYQFA